MMQPAPPRTMSLRRAQRHTRDGERSPNWARIKSTGRSADRLSVTRSRDEVTRSVVFQTVLRAQSVTSDGQAKAIASDHRVMHITGRPGVSDDPNDEVANFPEK
jgi:hypothetical protein